MAKLLDRHRYILNDGAVLWFHLVLHSILQHDQISFLLVHDAATDGRCENCVHKCAKAVACEVLARDQSFY